MRLVHIFKSLPVVFDFCGKEVSLSFPIHVVPVVVTCHITQWS